MNYHAHVFFKAEQTTLANKIRENLIKEFSRVEVGAFLPRAVGPLPQPMFQMTYPKDQYEAVYQKLRSLCHGHSVLIHPIMQDERLAHTVYATWIGEPLTLNLDNL